MKPIAMKDPATGRQGLFDPDTGHLYALDGSIITKMTVTEEIDLRALSDYAAAYAHANIARQVGHPVVMRDADGDERVITMDLSPADVHVPSAMPNFAGGYRLAEGAADIFSPAVQVGKTIDKYHIWDLANAFGRTQATTSAPGAAVAEVSPTLSTDQYTTQEYALACFVPTDVEANADAPLRPTQKAIQLVMDKLLIEREFRVATLATTTGNWDSNLVTALGATAKWNGGSTSDPVKDLHTIIELSWAPVTGIIMSERVHNNFTRNASVQKFIASKTGVAPLPDASSMSAILSLPPIHVAKMKTSVAGVPTYVWGNGCVLMHQPPENPPTDQQSIATSYTFRWNGGAAPDGSMTAGFMVRTYFDQRRTGRGGNVVVVVHNDSEKMTSKYVGGLITGCYQLWLPARPPRRPPTSSCPRPR